MTAGTVDDPLLQSVATLADQMQAAFGPGLLGPGIYLSLWAQVGLAAVAVVPGHSLWATHYSGVRRTLALLAETGPALTDAQRAAVLQLVAEEPPAMVVLTAVASIGTYIGLARAGLPDGVLAMADTIELELAQCFWDGMTALRRQVQ